jgi:hypothetical protein
MVRIFVTEERSRRSRPDHEGLAPDLVEPALVDRLARLRGPGETFSHVIMRQAAEA